jgi:hypothetical protein
VLKRTKASIPLALAAAAGAPLTSPPANALTNLLQGRHSHHRHSHRSHGRDRNRSRNRPRILIRIHVYNRNDNRARAVISQPGRRAIRPGRPIGDTDPIPRNLAKAGAAAPGADDAGAGMAAGHPDSGAAGSGGAHQASQV